MFKKENKPDELNLLDDFCNASSSEDMTGLIPAGIKREEELEAYDKMYNFLPSSITEESKSSSTDKGK